MNPTVTLTSIALDIFQPVTTRIFHCTAADEKGLTSPVTLGCYQEARSQGQRGHTIVPPLLLVTCPPG